MTVKVVSTKDELAPWTRGPFELIRHADGHLKDKDDTDRRIALIGFDNAIEVCIDVFIKLHPKLRKGKTLEKEVVARATQNYHTKIEWLEKYSEENELELDFSIEEIVWYHSLRNELYHSGNGMVPETYVLESARIAALGVFRALFGFDVAPLLDKNMSQTPRNANWVMYPMQNDPMDFLRLFVEFERTLQRSLYSFPSSTSRTTYVSVPQMWKEFTSHVPVLPEWNERVATASAIRNSIAHGRLDNLSNDEIEEASFSLLEVIEFLNERIPKGMEKPV